MTTPISNLDATADSNARVDDSMPDTEATPQGAEEVAARLALLKPFDYDRIRREKAKELGIQVKTLDDLVKAARKPEPTEDRLPFPEVIPHPAPINPADLLGLMADTLRRYVVMTLEQADACALWIAMTWFIHVVQVAAIAIITAPEKACGKSQLLELFGRLVARPLPAASSSASFLFRAIAVWRPTILIDEADTFIRENEELKGLVNAGHTRANAYVGRTVAVGDTHEPRLFDVWAAKAFAGIALEKHLPDATMSRGIVINLRRKLPHEGVERLRHADPETFATIASMLARFAEDYADQVREARPHLPDELGDRAQDNWEALLAIAACGGPEWVDRATRAALALSCSGREAVSSGNELLRDIKRIFDGLRDKRIRSVELIKGLCRLDEAGWDTYNRGKPITPRQLAKLLATYDISSKTIRFANNDTPKGFDAAQFEDAFSRYLSGPEKLPQRRHEDPDEDSGASGGVADDPPHSRHAANLPTQRNELTRFDYTSLDSDDSGPSTGQDGAGNCGGVADTEGPGAVDESGRPRDGNFEAF